MSAVNTIPVESWHIDYVADNLRSADRDELIAAGYDSFREIMARSVELSSYAATAEVDGVPIAIFGLVVSNPLSGRGVPWLLGTDGIMGNSRSFLDKSVQGIEQMKAICPYMENHVHAKNKVSIKWLKWLGFTIGEKFTMESGEDFYKFYMRN